MQQAERKSLRQECDLAAKIFYNGRVLYGIIENVGSGGCRLSGGEYILKNLKMGDNIDVLFSYKNIRCSCLGKVVRDAKGEYPLGVKFYFDDFGQKESLNILVMHEVLSQSS